LIMSSLDQQLVALAAMSSAQLREEWLRVMRTAPPAFSPDLMERAIAYELQARRHGGLAPAVQRALDRVSRRLAGTGKVSPPRETRLKPGTRLSRDWHGRSEHVLVIDEGYLFEERRYRSLSQVAAAITGTAWSGPRFFGLKAREAAGGQA
jgi:hypothetical protein